MKLVNGIWFPDSEKHLAEFKEVVEQGTYQKATLDAALKHVTQFRNAVDVGAHVGLWSMHLVKKFDCVHAFEPMMDHLQCFMSNVGGTFRINMIALGDHEHDTWMKCDEQNTGHTHINEHGEYTTKVRTLDSFNLVDVDFIKIDCEGYEALVCQGAKETLLRDKPVICVEQKFNKDALKYLESLGYRNAGNVKHDYFCTI